MEGIELVLKLRAAEHPPKIIAMSGGKRNPASDYLRMAQFLGADATLAKPFTHTELHDTIARVFADLAPV
jgi:CheY-like chemotaxis protein